MLGCIRDDCRFEIGGFGPKYGKNGKIEQKLFSSGNIILFFRLKCKIETKMTAEYKEKKNDVF